jgi:type II secretory pathway component PulL
MKKIAFFDLKGDQLLIHLLEKSGHTYPHQETISTSVREDTSFDTEKTFEEIEESYLSLPLSLLSFRIIEFPFSDMERIREVLRFELDGLVLGGAEDVVFDLLVLGESDGKHKVLVVYIRKEKLRTILDRLKALGVEPRVVTSVALASAKESFASAEGITSLLLNPKPILDEDRMNLVQEEMKIPTVNLRRGEFSYTLDTEKTKRSLKLTTILTAILALLFLLDMAFRIVSTKGEILSVKDEINKTYLNIFPNEKKITNALYQMKSHLKEIKEKERVLMGISPLQFLLDLTSMSGSGTSFTELTIDKERIILKGECSSLSQVQQMKGRLERFLTDVNISDTKPLSTDRTGFTITAKGRKP